MSFLDDLFSTTKKTAAAAGKKTDSAVKITRLKFKITQINSEIKAKYEKLGELIYQMNKSGDKDNESFEAYVAEIDALYDKKAELSLALDELRNVVTCTECGAKTSNENNFCPKCGAKLPETVKPEETPADETDKPEE